VLCDIHSKSKDGEKWEESWVSDWTYIGKSASLPCKVLKWAGLILNDGAYDGDPYINPKHRKHKMASDSGTYFGTYTISWETTSGLKSSGSLEHIGDPRDILDALSQLGKKKKDET